MPASLVADVDRAIRPLLDQIDLDALGRVNALYRHYAGDRFARFVATERGRWLKALDLITATRPTGTVCDLGCFIPWLPLALAQLGYRVTVVDRYALYGEPFRAAIARTVEARGIRLVDRDILADDLTPLGVFDVVLLLTVVEHLNGTPRHLLEKIHGRIAPGGSFLFEVPNIAGFLKRVGLLLGRSPLAHYADYYESTYPHPGHNREMTVAEVRDMLQWAGFALERLECYDYDPQPVRTLGGRLALLAKRLLPLRDAGESIMALARPA